ncbi:hypothetical protein Cni_G16710 [Canna indica]|uniref:Prolamin-like domain-containing protein n=1 Tax=Canna indica TaxID=4628 RepID=A0AAQ3KFQ7_9LILI|nr:hypothetical protein Cni_G16710 [Canna indica]
MSSLQKLAIAFIVASLTSGFAAGRELPSLQYSAAELHSSAANLEARLMAGIAEKDGIIDCWNALMDLRSCTNEIVLFFLNGESYLGLDCCRAIRVITHHCWTSMLSTLGFTTQESDILRGYCDAETADAPPPAPEALAPPPMAEPPAAFAPAPLLG